MPKWKPSEEDFEDCERVLEWLENWYKKEWPQAIETIKILHDVQYEIPFNIEELEEDRDKFEEED